MRRIILILLILILLGCLGCTRKELHYGVIPHPGKIDLSAQWGSTEDIPGGIVAYLYPEGDPTKSDNEPIIEYISNRGSTILLPFGSYYGLIFNDYTEDILFRNMQGHQSAEAYMKRSDEAPFATRNPQTKHIGCLESFYNVEIETFTLSKASPTHSATVSPKLKTLKIELTISLEGAKNISYARGSLSGVNEAINLYTGRPNTESTANVIFDFEIIDNTIKASIRCFGINNINTGDIDAAVRNNLEIAFILKDGSQLIDEHYFDITEVIVQITPVENDGVYEDIVITLDEFDIVIPDVQGSGDGFNLVVGDWDDPIIKELY